MRTRNTLEHHLAAVAVMQDGGAFVVLMRNALVAVALEASRVVGRRIGELTTDALQLSLVRRLTRALDEATDPFDSTYESRAALRVAFGL